MQLQVQLMRKEKNALSKNDVLKLVVNTYLD